jgi:hypothetical protein
MKKNSDISLVKLLGKRLQEATIMKPGYEEGSKFFYNGGFKKLDDMGYKKGDIFTVVKLKSKVDISTPAKEGEMYLKTLQGPDNKKITFSGGLVSYKTFFNQMKSGISMTPSGEDWEALIVVAHSNKFEGPEWERAEKFWESYGEIAQKIAKDFKKQLKQKSLKQFGSSRASLSSDWIGTNNTPKTDIIGNNANISLKKKGGSQLLSGTKNEVAATFMAASKYVAKKDSKLVEGFIGIVEEKMKTLYYNGTVTDLKSKVASGELKPNKDSVVKEFEQMKLDQKELNNMMNEKIFNNDKFKVAFVFEAATGTSKFSSKEAIADTLVGFDADNGVITKIVSMKKVEDAKPIADNTRFYFSFKSSGKNPATVLRGAIGENKSSVQSLREIIVSEFGKFNKELGEGIQESLMSETSNLNELNVLSNLKNFIEKIPNAVKGTKDKFVDIVTNIFDKITAAFDKIKKMGEKMLQGIMDFFGFQFDEEGSTITSNDPDFPVM